MFISFGHVITYMQSAIASESQTKPQSGNGKQQRGAQAIPRLNGSPTAAEVDSSSAEWQMGIGLVLTFTSNDIHKSAIRFMMIWLEFLHGMLMIEKIQCWKENNI
jgi:hypothetical protein